MFLFENGKGRPSKTASMYIICMVAVLIKFFFSDFSLSLTLAGGEHSFAFGPLDPLLVAALVTASGAVYGFRRHTESQERIATKEPSETALEDLESLVEG